MQKTISLKLNASEVSNDAFIREKIAKETGASSHQVTGYRLLKKSLDARTANIYFNLKLVAFIDEPHEQEVFTSYQFPDITHATKRVIIVGAGPAGLFAALQLIQQGIKPVVIERGKEVRARRRDLAVLNKQGILNPESNYCFGEGGAGTYSDGKLYTRSNKRGNIDRVLQLFVQFGAAENILYEAHPHIGTNKLPKIISAMREQIRSCGGEVLFETKLTGLQLSNDQIEHIVTADGDRLKADAYILATGHSARDIYQLLHDENIMIEAKPFALGVRVEHPQDLIDRIQYHCEVKPDFLPPASYSLVQQVNKKGVFSFCMCPGGIIAPASTSAGELVVNGWSPSKRDNPFANSGMVVQIEQAEAWHWMKNNKHLYKHEDVGSPLMMMHFQQVIEQQAYIAGGGNYVAPAQRMTDFVNRKTSRDVGASSYLPGLKPANLTHVLPAFVYDSLAIAFKSFGKKMKASSGKQSYYTQEANVVATESRTSSPVRIPRDAEHLAHPQVSNLYPCAEGAGYAGGIVSAAMDGERVANMIAKKILNL